MLPPLYISKRLGLLILGTSLAVVANAQPRTFGATEQQTPPPPSKAPAKAAPAPPTQAPAKAPAKSPAAAPAKAPAKAQAPAPKPAAKKPEPKKAPAKPAPKKEEAKKEEAKKEETPAITTKPHGRDPFLALLSATAGHGPLVLPPGPAGLQVSTVRVDGIVRSANGMIAVVTSPQGRTYFLHQGTRIFDGRIEQISMDGVTFQESGKDPFGNPVERTVVKRVYSSAGEQQ